MSSAQDPTRLLISRALFLVLFVFFVRRPKDLRLLVAVFVALALMTAWSGSQASIIGGGRPEIADYRAGGIEVLIESTQNPNRLALICTHRAGVDLGVRPGQRAAGLALGGDGGLAAAGPDRVSSRHRAAA